LKTERERKKIRGAAVGTGQGKEKLARELETQKRLSEEQQEKIRAEVKKPEPETVKKPNRDS